MRLALAASLLFLSVGSPAYACFCGSYGGCPALGAGRDPVFVGTVLAVTDLPRTEDFVFLSSRKAHFRVDESFGGIPSDVHEVDVLTGLGGGDCGIPFKAGEAYVVDAGTAKDGLLHAGIC